MVDDADYEAVNQFKWCARRDRHTFYAIRNLPRRSGTQRLHRFLLPGHSEIDHRDGDGLNNQRENLRPATSSQNKMGHLRKSPRASSRYRGVSWKNRDKKWAAQIQMGRKQIHLGTFQFEIEAAKAYDVAARKYFGEFASPNFPTITPDIAGPERNRPSGKQKLAEDGQDKQCPSRVTDGPQ